MKMEEYNKIDNFLDHLDFHYQNIDITYLVRNCIISAIRSQNNEGHRKIVINCKLLIRLFISLISTIHHLFSLKSIWVFSNVERRKKIGSYYIDRVASVVSEVYDDVSFIENPTFSLHKKPSKDIILSDAFFQLGSFIFSILFYKKKNLHIDKKLDRLINDYKISLSINSQIKRFVGQYRFMRFFLKYFSNPKLVFIVYPNGYNGYILAMKERNIPIIELQHGVIYPSHISYNTILFAKSKQFKPDAIFTYGFNDKICLSELNYIEKKENIWVVGSYGLWKAKNYETSISDYLQSKLSINKKTLVVIPTVNDLYELLDFCKELEKLDRSLCILILPRMKPAHKENTNCITLLDIEQTNIFETYKVADFLLTKVSTCALESLYMDIPTFIYEESGKSSFFKENYGFIQSFNYVSSPSALMKSIKNNNYYFPDKKDVEQIFAMDLIKNFKSAVEFIENKR